MACRAHSHLQDLVPHVQPPAAPVPIAGDGGARRGSPGESREEDRGGDEPRRHWAARPGRRSHGVFARGAVPWGVRMVLDGDRARVSSFDPKQTARCFRDFATGHRSFSLSLSLPLFFREGNSLPHKKVGKRCTHSSVKKKKKNSI